ncbi:MAG: hypothetical protein WC297_02415 [Candidatus Paceibacterota bacterium]|jgi:hypothetical protein
MPEKLPQFERPEPIIVGPASLEKKEEAKRSLLDRFGEGHLRQIPEKSRKILESLEYHKKPAESETIRLANETTNILLSKYDLVPFDIPERNIHIVPKKLYKEVDNTPDRVATTFLDKQLIAIDAGETMLPLDRAETIFHETVHLKGFHAEEVHEDLQKPYRGGLKVGATRKKSEKIGFFMMFEGLNEAVVSEIVKQYLPKIFKENTYLEKELEWENSEEARKIKEKLSKAENINPEEIICSSKDREIIRTHPYHNQRKVLYFLCESIYADNESEFETKDKVMEEFFRAYFNGRLLKIAHLIEKSFDKGSFRILGMMDSNQNSAIQILDYLRKHRTNKKENQGA